jgi:hypothetical protein
MRNFAVGCACAARVPEQGRSDAPEVGDIGWGPPRNNPSLCLQAVSVVVHGLPKCRVVVLLGHAIPRFHDQIGVSMICKPLLPPPSRS